MTNEQILLTLTSAIALVSLVLSALAWRRASRAESRTHSHAERLALLESPLASAPPAAVGDSDHSRRVPDATYVITHLDGEPASTEPGAPVLAGRIDGRLFADIVARETVVKAASWTHGVRRALAPEARNRIRFQVRQETRRAGRDRKAEMKVALREYRARSRSAGPEDRDVSEDVA